jgi:hypothetical protein
VSLHKGESKDNSYVHDSIIPANKIKRPHMLNVIDDDEHIRIELDKLLKIILEKECE